MNNIAEKTSTVIDADSMAPKYEQVKKSLLTYITEMANEDEYLPYEFEMEAMFNVSKRTIRRALKDLREDGIIETVRNRGSKVLTRNIPTMFNPPSPNGVNGEGNQLFLNNKIIGSIVCSDQPGEARTGFFPWRITEGLEKMAGQAEGTVQVHNLREEKWRDHDVVIAALRASGVEWTFLYPHPNHQPEILLKKLVDNGIRPAVYLLDMNSINEIATDLAPGIDWVITNNLYGINRILHREFADVDFIAYVGSQLEKYWEQPRIEVYKRFAREQEIPFEEILDNLDVMNQNQPLVHDDALDKRQKIGYALAAKLPDTIRQYQNPLIVGANDSYALGILKYFSEKRIKVPEEAKVMGYDNRNEAMQNNLSSFDNNCEMVAKCLFEFCQNFYTRSNSDGDFASGRTVYSKFIKRMSTGYNCTNNNGNLS